ncbi:ABC transporter substrate-binding protein [Rugamonas sp.]|uniref:substrate-binding periplasmic protein n=1 Tax=Rugamonas sp. TaxID=1926287 RepID=UPI0025F10470|nr:transporter substrate-binding domain-containing protein [Rugamonas sp.]
MPARRSTTLCACAAILFGAVSVPASAGCDKTLSISSSDYAPYIYRDPAGKWSGLDVELMQAIFKAAGCTYTFAPLVAPKRMVDMVSSGETDVLLAASESEERRRANYFGLAYRHESVSLVGLAGKVGGYRDIRAFAALRRRGVRLLVPNAGWYGDDYASALPALRDANLAVEFTYFDQGIRMLAAGRGKLMMSDTGAMFAAARKEGVAIEALPFTVIDAPVHMMFSKASVSEHDVKQLDAATARLEKQGVLKTIRAAYGLR